MLLSLLKHKLLNRLGAFPHNDENSNGFFHVCFFKALNIPLKGTNNLHILKKAQIVSLEIPTLAIFYYYYYDDS